MTVLILKTLDEIWQNENFDCTFASFRKKKIKILWLLNMIERKRMPNNSNNNNDKIS